MCVPFYNANVGSWSISQCDWMHWSHTHSHHRCWSRKNPAFLQPILIYRIIHLISTLLWDTHRRRPLLHCAAPHSRVYNSSLGPGWWYQIKLYKHNKLLTVFTVSWQVEPTVGLQTGGWDDVASEYRDGMSCSYLGSAPTSLGFGRAWNSYRFSFSLNQFQFRYQILIMDKSLSGPGTNFSEPFGFNYFKLEPLRSLSTCITVLTWRCHCEGPGRLLPCHLNPFKDSTAAAGRWNSRKWTEFLVPP